MSTSPEKWAINLTDEITALGEQIAYQKTIANCVDELARIMGSEETQAFLLATAHELYKGENLPKN